MQSSRTIRLLVITSFSSIALALFALALQADAEVALTQPGGVTVLPGQGVDFQQVDFLFTEVIVWDSDWGQVSANPEELFDSTGIFGGYLNVYTDEGWVVQNLPVALGDGSHPIATYFTLGLVAPQDVSLLSAYVELAPSPQLSFADGPRSDFPVGIAEWNAEGAGESQTTDVGAAPQGNQAFPGGPTTQYTLSHAANVETAMNQCFPMSIANSLQYLENRFRINVPHNHQPGLKGDSTLVGKLDTKANRIAPARNSGSGMWFTPMLEGKFAYLDEYGLKGSFIHKHQGRGWGSSPNQALPNGDLQRSGITSMDQGDKVTWQWICDEIKAGEDVEIAFSYDDKDGKPTGGHAVRVFACGTTLGDPWLGYLHDRLQTNEDPMDSKGLEQVYAKTVDLDSDGLLNLGSEDREIRFAMSESRAIPSGTDKLTARVFIDDRCDGFFQNGVDIPWPGVVVTISFPNGSSEPHLTTSSGMVYIAGFDGSGGVTVSVALPPSYRGRPRASCINSPTMITLPPSAFAGHIGHKHVQFRAR